MSAALITARGSGRPVPPPRHTNASRARDRLAARPGPYERRGFAPFTVRADSNAGSIDGLEAALVRYCATTTGDVVVDGSGLRCIHGPDLGVLVDVEALLRPLGRHLVLQGFGASCREAFERVGLAASVRLVGGPNAAAVARGTPPPGSPASA